MFISQPMAQAIPMIELQMMNPQLPPPPPHAIVSAAGAPPKSSTYTPSSTNLYVRHLPLDIDDKGLRAIFSPFGTITSSMVMRDIHSGQSLGTAFVRFESHEEAANALQHTDAHSFGGGRPLSVQWAKQQHDSTPAGEERKKMNKLFLRNVPLDVTNAMLESLCTPFGAVRRVSLHEDTACVGTPSLRRRIAFVTFAEEGAAEAALQALHTTQPFDSCKGIPVLCKLSENYALKPHSGGQDNGSTASGDTSQVEGSSLPDGATMAPTMTSPFVLVSRMSSGQSTTVLSTRSFTPPQGTAPMSTTAAAAATGPTTTYVPASSVTSVGVVPSASVPFSQFGATCAVPLPSNSFIPYPSPSANSSTSAQLSFSTTTAAAPSSASSHRMETASYADNSLSSGSGVKVIPLNNLCYATTQQQQQQPQQMNAVGGVSSASTPMFMDMASFLPASSTSPQQQQMVRVQQGPNSTGGGAQIMYVLQASPMTYGQPVMVNPNYITTAAGAAAATTANGAQGFKEGSYQLVPVRYV